MRVQNVFHVSMLRMDISDARHVLEYEYIGIKSNMLYNEQSVEILNLGRVLRNKD